MREPINPRRPHRIATWHEGAVAVPLSPRTLPLARFIAARTPDVDVSLPGTCMLVRRTERALICWTQALHATVTDLWHGRLPIDAAAGLTDLDRAAVHHSAPA